MIDIGSAATLLGTLGIGSVVGQYLSGAKDRRAARADVLHALSVVESARWAPHEPGEPLFRDASRRLQTAALVARVPRAPVVHYLQLAQAASWLSDDSWDDAPDPEFGGGINMELGSAVRLAARGLSDVIWAGVVTRVLVQRRARRRTEQQLLLVKNKACVEAIDRASGSLL